MADKPAGDKDPDSSQWSVDESQNFRTSVNSEVQNRLDQQDELLLALSLAIVDLKTNVEDVEETILTSFGELKELFAKQFKSVVPLRQSFEVLSSSDEGDGRSQDWSSLLYPLNSRDQRRRRSIVEFKG